VNKPDIQTAVPARRYAIGDFTATLLGEIQSRDPVQYHYILALIPDRSAEPILYVTAEALPPDLGGPGVVARVIAETGERVLGPNPRWRDADAFVDDALEMVRKVLGLAGEEARRLL
jgi:hypothetical protein